MKIAILGAAGHMDHKLCDLAAQGNELEVVSKVDIAEGYDHAWRSDVKGVVDFSYHTAVPGAIRKAAEAGESIRGPNCRASEWLARSGGLMVECRKLVLVLGLSIASAVGAATGEAEGRVYWDFPRLGNCQEGMAFADGVTGVLVWGGDDELRLTVGRADLWDHRGGYPWTEEQSYTNIVSLWRSGEKERLLGLFTRNPIAGEPRNPYLLPLGRVVVKMPGARLHHGELNTRTGVGTIALADGRLLEFAMSKDSRTFAIRFPDGLAYSVSTFPAMSQSSVRRVLESIGFTRPTMRPNGFDWSLPADPSVSLDFIRNGRELLVATRRGDAPQMKAVPFVRIMEESRTNWAHFWATGARVSVPDPVLQRIFDYGIYRFGAMTDPDGVPAGLQGPWTEDDRLVPWNGDYHFNINVQECYSPAYRSGHFENLMPLFRMILSWRPRLRENARKFVGLENGYVLPHSVDDRGVCIGGFWTGTIDHASTAWMAVNMFRYVRYSGNVDFLRESAYDFMTGAMNVYLAMMEESSDGTLALPFGPSPEWMGSDFHRAVGRNPSFQLAVCHRLSRNLIEAAKSLGVQPDPRWIDVEKRLPRYSLSDGSTKLSIGIFEGVNLTESHRHHSHMAGIYPFDVIPRGQGANGDILLSTYRNWTRQGTGLWTGWCVPWASILQTDAGNAIAAVAMLRAWDAYFCDEGHGSHHNAVFDGFTTFGDGRRVMQMDGQCGAATAVMELLVHEIDGEAYYFRGCPKAWKDVSFENVALSDGRRVSGKRSDGIETITVSPANINSPSLSTLP